MNAVPQRIYLTAIGHFLELAHNDIQLFFVNAATAFLNIIPSSAMAGGLAENHASGRDAYGLGRHDLVSSGILQQAVLGLFVVSAKIKDCPIVERSLLPLP